MNRNIKIAYDASGNIKYWGITTATGKELINRYDYDASSNLTEIKEERLGVWKNRETMDWS